MLVVKSPLTGGGREWKERRSCWEVLRYPSSFSWGGGASVLRSSSSFSPSCVEGALFSTLSLWVVHCSVPLPEYVQRYWYKNYIRLHFFFNHSMCFSAVDEIL